MTKEDPSYPAADATSDEQPPQAPVFKTAETQPRLLSDLLRALILLFSLAVAAGFVLLILPQQAIDKMADGIRSHYADAQLEKIEFLYLGDEIKDGSFHIRGVVRNISNASIENMDAALRLYSNIGSLAETTLVRMDKEVIAPNTIALFDLVYPNYQMQFKSYSVEFKLRDGGVMPYKDMRANAVGSPPTGGDK
jgi:hypothetical protein